MSAQNESINNEIISFPSPRRALLAFLSRWGILIGWSVKSPLHLRYELRTCVVRPCESATKWQWMSRCGWAERGQRARGRNTSYKIWRPMGSSMGQLYSPTAPSPTPIRSCFCRHRRLVLLLSLLLSLLVLLPSISGPATHQHEYSLFDDISRSPSFHPFPVFSRSPTLSTTLSDPPLLHRSLPAEHPPFPFVGPLIYITSIGGQGEILWNDPHEIRRCSRRSRFAGHEEPSLPDTFLRCVRRYSYRTYTYSPRLFASNRERPISYSAANTSLGGELTLGTKRVAESPTGKTPFCNGLALPIRELFGLVKRRDHMSAIFDTVLSNGLS